MSDTEINSAFTVIDEDKTEDQESAPPSLWKQLLGAVVGATIALILYGIYEAAAPVVTAMVTPSHAEEEKKAEPVSAAKRVQRTSGAQKRVQE